MNLIDAELFGALNLPPGLFNFNKPASQNATDPVDGVATTTESSESKDKSSSNKKKRRKNEEDNSGGAEMSKEFRKQLKKLKKLKTAEPVLALYDHQLDEVEREAAAKEATSHVKPLAAKSVRMSKADQQIFNARTSLKVRNADLGDLLDGGRLATESQPETSMNPLSSSVETLMFGVKGKPQGVRAQPVIGKGSLGFVDEDGKLVGRVQPHSSFGDPEETAKAIVQRKRRQLLEQQNFKRIKGIKSKKFKKIHRKQNKLEEQKALSELAVKNPEVAERIRGEYETKRAELRMMRRQKNRSKWAKLAQRYGSHELQRSVQEQQDMAVNERRLVEQLASKCVAMGEDEDDDDDQIEEEEKEEETEPVKGVLADWEEEALESDEEENRLHEDYLSKIKKIIDETPTEGTTTLSKREIPKSVDITTQVNDPTFLTPKKKNDEVDFSAEAVTQTFSTFKTMTSSLKGGSDDGDDLVNEVFQVSSQFEEDFDKQQRENEAAETLTSNPDSMAGWGSWAGPGVKPRQRRPETDRNNNKNNKNINISNNRHVESEVASKSFGAENEPVFIHTIDKPFQNIKTSLTKPRVVFNQKATARLEKYFVSNVPFPFVSDEQYNASISHPLGVEWNGPAKFRQLNKSKVVTRIGRAIAPLALSPLEQDGD